MLFVILLTIFSKHPSRAFIHTAWTKTCTATFLYQNEYNNNYSVHSSDICCLLRVSNTDVDCFLRIVKNMITLACVSR